MSSLFPDQPDTLLPRFLSVWIAVFTGSIRCFQEASLVARTGVVGWHEDNFASISRFGGSGKLGHAWITGRFGVGFNSVYHLTDFISGKYKGSYSSAKAAARAYDTAVYYLRGPSVRLNFPELVGTDDAGQLLLSGAQLSADALRAKAIEVGSRVDALETTTTATNANTSFNHPPPSRDDEDDELDLNKMPEPEPGDESDQNHHYFCLLHATSNKS
ncbi:uncharacterized protein LOC141659047 [Apium graveolens]|uniref:uncharacterized protein LOC141659047 n=1 Tax=Apium graveolens TaxID=4045 RepID=UPI003D7A29F7